MNDLKSVSQLLLDVARVALDKHGYFSTEDGRAHQEDKISLHEALIEALPSHVSCECELPMAFAGPRVPPPEPPSELGPAKDVCGKGSRDRRLDFLLQHEGRTVALEVKHRRITEWRGTFEDGATLLPRKKVDTYGYFFLKDVHRLERLLEVRGSHGPVVPDQRVAMFLTNDPYEYEGQVPHDALKLSARALEPEHLVQYNRFKLGGAPTSTNTLWVSYPPFFLAGRYDIRWQPLNDDVSRFRTAASEHRPFPCSQVLMLNIGSGLNDGIPINA